MASNYRRNNRRRNDKNNPYKDDLSISGLDNCRLYITQLPDNFTRKDLQKEFSQFGKLLQCHKSTDKSKNYALVKYSTPGQARIAMAKMNKAEPYGLKIEIAQKEYVKDNKKSGPKNNDGDKTPDLNISESSIKDGFEDFSDEDLDEEEIPYCDDYVEEEETDIHSIENLDPDLQFEMEKLRLMEAQILYKQRYRSFVIAKQKNAISGGALLGNFDDSCYQPESIMNKIINIPLPLDTTKLMPPLTVSVNNTKPCVFCGFATKLLCNRCRITPYCNEACQKQDWGPRHSSICHNLASNRLITTNILIPHQIRETKNIDNS